VRDLAMQERESDLVLATFGRGFYVLDDISPLRQVSAATFAKDGHIFPTKPAAIELPETGRARGSQGEQLWMGENRPFGATVTYWVKDTPKTLRDERQDAFRAAEAKKETPQYPSPAQLTAEADEEAPQTYLTVTNAAGAIVRRLVVPGARGIHRTTWDLRGTGPALPPTGGTGGAGGGFGGQQALGGFVAPGTYTLTLSRRVRGTTSTLGDPQPLVVNADPAITLTPAQITSARDYQERVFRLQRSFTGALEQANQLRTRTQAIRRAVVASSAALRLLDTAVGFDERTLAVLRTLRGNETLRGLESGAPSNVQARVNSATAGARGLTGAPTATQQQNYTIALEDVTSLVGLLRGLETEVRKFEQELEAAGVPYTPGRWPGQ
jgi:hypothetical protein